MKNMVLLAVMLFISICALAQGLPAVLLSPANGASGISVTSVGLTWMQPDYVPGVTYFEVYFGFPQSVVQVYSGLGTELESGNYQFTLYRTDLAYNSEYLWFVLTFPFIGGFPQMSSPSVFTTELVPVEPPVLMMPADGAVNIHPLGLQFIWQQPGYNSNCFYYIYCDTDPDFVAAPIYSGFAYEYQIGDEFVYAYYGIQEHTTYFWKVEVSGPGVFWQSEIRSFSTLNLDAPEVYISDDGVLHWQPVSNADYYIIYKSSAPNGQYEYLGQTTDTVWQDPLFPQSKGFYQVTSFMIEDMH
jgi:hypothetical protein